MDGRSTVFGSSRTGEFAVRDIGTGRMVSIHAGPEKGPVLCAYVAFKWWERRRLYKTLRVARITVEELRKLMGEARKPVIVDPRAQLPGDERRSIPGAIVMHLAEVRDGRSGLPLDNDIVFFCDCPNEASAASAAKALMDLGYTRVRPLLGGLDAWIAAGYELAPPLPRQL
jgi:rhodanese-related sulfurtransferase